MNQILLTWNVYNYNINANRIELFNIFCHSSFRKDVTNDLKEYANKSKFAENVGDRFKITLDTDNEITVIIGDIKQDVHTDYFNQYTPIYDENGIFFSGNVLEFIVDTDVLPKVPRRLGTVSYFDYLKGNIKSIERIETEE